MTLAERDDHVEDGITVLRLNPRHAAINIGDRTQILASTTQDFQEAMLAFVEKRAPRFTDC